MILSARSRFAIGIYVSSTQICFAFHAPLGSMVHQAHYFVFACVHTRRLVVICLRGQAACIMWHYLGAEAARVDRGPKRGVAGLSRCAHPGRRGLYTVVGQ